MSKLRESEAVAGRSHQKRCSQKYHKSHRKNTHAGVSPQQNCKPLGL